MFLILVNWKIGHGKWFLHTNLFLIKPFLITTFDEVRRVANVFFNFCTSLSLSKYFNKNEPKKKCYGQPLKLSTNVSRYEIYKVRKV